MEKYVMMLVLCLCLSMASCRTQEEGGESEEQSAKTEAVRTTATLGDFTIETYPKVDGSTSAQPLQVLVACRLLGSECAWYSFGFGGPYGVPGEARLFAVAPVQAGVQAEAHKKNLNLAASINGRIVHRGTHKSYVNLVNGKTDLILVAREPSEDELKLAKEKGVELDKRPVALDAFVFIANRENPVANLTTQQMRDIYTGKIKNWKDVAGPDLKINPYQRERNSGSQELMEKLVMKGLKMIDAPDLIVMGMMGPFNRLERDKQGLAYSVFFYEERMAISQKTKLVAVDGVMPSSDTIRARKYPYASEVYVVVRKGMDEKSPACRLRDWLLSKEGQAVVAESGYVSIHSK